MDRKKLRNGGVIKRTHYPVPISRDRTLTLPFTLTSVDEVISELSEKGVTPRLALMAKTQTVYFHGGSVRPLSAGHMELLDILLTRMCHDYKSTDIVGLATECSFHQGDPETNETEDDHRRPKMFRVLPKVEAQIRIKSFFERVKKELDVTCYGIQDFVGLLPVNTVEDITELFYVIKAFRQG